MRRGLGLWGMEERRKKRNSESWNANWEFENNHWPKIENVDVTSDGWWLGGRFFMKGLGKMKEWNWGTEENVKKLRYWEDARMNVWKKKIHERWELEVNDEEELEEKRRKVSRLCSSKTAWVVSVKREWSHREFDTMYGVLNSVCICISTSQARISNLNN